MYYVRENRHLGNREQYNGKRFGSNYSGGKSNSTASFMFFNYPEEWGMGNLWMVFKRYGTVFDMFMVQRRLRNGKKYGFVRFKFVQDIESLLARLQSIKLKEEYLRVYIAHDRDRDGKGVKGNTGTKQDTNTDSDDMDRNVPRDGGNNKRDTRSFVDVVNTGSARKEWRNMKNNNAGMKAQHGSKGVDAGSTRNQNDNMDRAKEQPYNQDGGRTITIHDKDANNELINRSVVGEVKASCFLHNLPLLCEEQGLNNIEVKFLGGLEVMVVMENIETATNVIEDREHGLRRWLYKLRRGTSLNRTAGRQTWINIIGVPIS